MSGFQSDGAVNPCGGYVDSLVHDIIVGLDYITLLIEFFIFVYDIIIWM